MGIKSIYSFAEGDELMPYFWTFESDLPSGMGVGSFSLAHIIVLILSAIIIFLIIQLYRKQADFGRRNIKMTLAALLIMLFFHAGFGAPFSVIFLIL